MTARLFVYGTLGPGRSKRAHPFRICLSEAQAHSASKSATKLDGGLWILLHDPVSGTTVRRSLMRDVSEDHRFLFDDSRDRQIGAVSAHSGLTGLSGAHARALGSWRRHSSPSSRAFQSSDAPLGAGAQSQDLTAASGLMVTQHVASRQSLRRQGRRDVSETDRAGTASWLEVRCWSAAAHSLFLGTSDLAHRIAIGFTFTCVEPT